MSIHLFGIRHHGPGSARSLLTALDALQPDMIVMEGPADAESMLPLAVHPQMRPPVALLLVAQDDPRSAVYYPLAEFSPEWQTLQWAHRQHVPVRLMDLPQTHHLAMQLAQQQKNDGDSDESETPYTEEARAIESEMESEPASVWRDDPLVKFAEAAGYRDHEQWWDEQVERRANATDLFAAIAEAMRAVREDDAQARPRDLLREAYMRKVLREVSAQGYSRIAVVCGAWHTPALEEDALGGKRKGCRAKDDNERLRGLPKTKVKATWIPWTHSRLTYRSGYGAGVHSPGWYAHLWHAPRDAGTRWIASAARLMREKDLDASSASVIEAVRLADALAAMRDLHTPGMQELNEAILAVLCRGDATPMDLVRRRLEIGDCLGEVPAETPTVPLAQDLANLQKSLRLKPSSEQRILDLDLRKENDLERSRLLFRLRLLDIAWGKLESQGSRTSTFHEVWMLEWQPEFAIKLIEANVWGNTVEAAATARIVDLSNSASDVSQLAEQLDTAIFAGLNSAVDPLLLRIQAQATVAADVRHLLEALLPLARTARYGDVRGTSAEHVEPILLSLFRRALVGLSAASAMLDDEAAERMVTALGHAQDAVALLNRADLREEWLLQIRQLAHAQVHGLLRGWCCRLLIEQRVMSDDELFQVASLALSPANPPHECAAWATGLLRGSGLVLLQADGLWQVFDRWLVGLTAEAFVEMLPLVRRAFSDFTSSERRRMGEKVKSLGALGMNSAAGLAAPGLAAPASATRGSASATSLASRLATRFDIERGKLALPVLAEILGVRDVATGE